MPLGFRFKFLSIKLENWLPKLPSCFNRLIARIIKNRNIIEHYHPTENQPGKRTSTYARWEVISQHIPDSASLCIDLGCNTGFFANHIAQKGIFTIGFDVQTKNIVVANAQYQVDNLLFKELDLNSKTAERLPQSDIVIFLSVFHHLVRHIGQAEALQTLTVLAQKCTRRFFFETGQPNEVGTKFYQQMDFIGDIESWTQDFFIHQCHFSNVHCLGEFDTFLTPTPRKLFVAVR